MMLLKKVLAASVVAATALTGAGTAVILAQAEPEAVETETTLVEIRHTRAGLQKQISVTMQMKLAGEGVPVAYSQLTIDRAEDDKGRILKQAVGSYEQAAAMMGAGDEAVPTWSSLSRVKSAQEGLHVTAVLEAPAEDAGSIRNLHGSLYLHLAEVKEVAITLRELEQGHVKLPALAEAGIEMSVPMLNFPEGERRGSVMVRLTGEDITRLAGATFENPDGQAVRSTLGGVRDALVAASGPLGPETVLRLQLAAHTQKMKVGFTLRDADIPPQSIDVAGPVGGPAVSGGGVTRARDGTPLMLVTVTVPTEMAAKTTAARGIDVAKATDEDGFALHFRPDGLNLRGWGETPASVLSRWAPVARSHDGRALTVQLPMEPPMNAEAETFGMEGKVLVTVAEETRDVVVALDNAANGKVQNAELEESGLTLTLQRRDAGRAGARPDLEVAIDGKFRNLAGVALQDATTKTEVRAVAGRQYSADDPPRIRFVGVAGDEPGLVITVATSLADAEIPFKLEGARLPASRPRRSTPGPGVPPDTK